MWESDEILRVSFFSLPFFLSSRLSQRLFRVLFKLMRPTVISDFLCLSFHPAPSARHLSIFKDIVIQYFLKKTHTQRSLRLCVRPPLCLFFEEYSFKNYDNTSICIININIKEWRMHESMCAASTMTNQTSHVKIKFIALFDVPRITSRVRITGGNYLLLLLL